MFAKIVSHPFVAGLLLFLGYEGYKQYELRKGPSGGFVMTPGHMMGLSFTYGGPGLGGQLDNAQVQTALDMQNPAMFDVISACEDPTAKAIRVSAVFTGPASTAVSPAHLSMGWPDAYGKLTVTSVQDLGGAPQLAPAVV